MPFILFSCRYKLIFGHTIFFPVHTLPSNYNHSVAGIRPAHLPAHIIFLTVYFIGDHVRCSLCCKLLMYGLKIIGQRSDLFARERSTEAQSVKNLIGSQLDSLNKFGFFLDICNFLKSRLLSVKHNFQTEGYQHFD